LFIALGARERVEHRFLGTGECIECAAQVIEDTRIITQGEGLLGLREVE
jgi:hypothetical protein